MSIGNKKSVKTDNNQNVLEKEYEILGSSSSDIWMRHCIAAFSSFITFDEKYIKRVKEVQKNAKQIRLFNSMKEIRSINIIKKNGKQKR